MIKYLECMASWLWRIAAVCRRHRADRLAVVRFPPTPPCERLKQLQSDPAPTVRAWHTPIDGASTPLVRPYLAAHEREEEARLQRLGRDTLWCTAYGVDLDVRDIHAVLGAAA
ncbi:hypothetical protein QFZ76_007240 [Streptomyces sp. V4I2]|nr:hypothetical protein [Streptomyces sp. V4I2]